MAAPLTSQPDVETALLRPLTPTEQTYIDGLIDQASGLLRQAAPAVDARISRYATDPTDPGAIAPDVVATLLASVIKRYLVNPNGVVSRTDGVGPFSRSESYALRSDKDRRGALEITAEDLAVLFPARGRRSAGTIRTPAALAPRPVGRYGPLPSGAEAVDAIDTYSAAPAWLPPFMP